METYKDTLHHIICSVFVNVVTWNSRCARSVNQNPIEIAKSNLLSLQILNFSPVPIA